MNSNDCPDCNKYASVPDTEDMSRLAIEAMQEGTNPMIALGIDTSNIDRALYDLTVYRIMCEAGLAFFDWDDHDTEMMRRQLRLVNKTRDALKDFTEQNMEAVNTQRKEEDGT